MKKVVKLIVLLIVISLSNCKQEQEKTINLKEQEKISNYEKNLSNYVDSARDLSKLDVKSHFDIITRYPFSVRPENVRKNIGLDNRSKADIKTYINSIKSENVKMNYDLNSVSIQYQSSDAIKVILNENSPNILDLKLLVLEQQKSHSQNYPVIIRALSEIKKIDQTFVNEYINNLKNDKVINDWMNSAYEKLERAKRNKKDVPKEAQIIFTKNLELAETHMKKLEIFRKTIFDLENTDK